MAHHQEKRINDKTKKIINTVIFVIFVFALALSLYFILKALGITNQASLQALINKTGLWGPLVFLLLQITITTLLSVIPGTSLTFLILAGVIFDNIFLALFIALTGVWLSSILMFMIGDTLGEKVAIKLIGEESLRYAQELIDTKSRIYLPIMFLFPFFPDDGLCLAAGLTKMKYRYFVPVVLIFRSVGVIVTVSTSFYHKSISDILGLTNLSPIGWFILVNLLLFDGYVLYKFTKVIEKKINANKKVARENKDAKAPND